MHTRHVYAAIGLLLLLIFAWFVWPTPYRYFPNSAAGETSVVRENRFTHSLDLLTLQKGWYRLKQER